MAALLVACVLVLASCGSGKDSGHVVTRAGGEVTLDRLGEPYSGAAAPGLVGAGRDVFAVGGVVVNDGDQLTGKSVASAARFDLGEGRWIELPSIPSEPPLDLPGLVWTGDEMIVVGTPCDGVLDGSGDDEFPNCGDAEAAAQGPAIKVFVFSPGSGSWRQIDAPTELPRRTNGYPASVVAHGWTGQEAMFEIAIGGAPEAAGLWLLNPSTGRWRHGPERLPNRAECMIGSALYDSDVGEEIGEAGVSQLQDDLKAPIRTWKFDPDTLDWVELPPVEKPSVGQAQNAIRCQGGAMVFSPRTNKGENPGVLWFDATTDQWSPVPTFTNTPGDPLATFDVLGEASGTKVLAWPDTHRLLTLDAGSGRWQERQLAEAKDGLLPVGPVSGGILVVNGRHGAAVLRVDV